MGSPENPNWFFECPLIDDIPVAGAEFTAPPAGFYWSAEGFNASSSASVEIGGSFVNSDGRKESSSLKRVRPEPSNGPDSKACREKRRRDKLNDRFLELSSILDPEKPPKMDKAAVLSDASRMVTQLRSEAQKLKDSNENLQEKIKELKEDQSLNFTPLARILLDFQTDGSRLSQLLLTSKLLYFTTERQRRTSCPVLVRQDKMQAEKIELRDEKQRLKAEKDNLEQQVKMMNAGRSFMPHPPMLPTAFTTQGQKLMMPVIGYPGFPMWQFMPPSDVDTTQDAESCPPVA